MKEIIKKLALFGIFFAIVVFIIGGMASAELKRARPVMGHYVVTGSGHNFVSTTGFDADYKPNPCSQEVPAEMCITFQDTMIFQGDLIFNKDGTGTFTLLDRGIDTPPLAYNMKMGAYEFVYTKTGERTFTYRLKPNTYMKVEFIAGGSTGQTVFFEVAGHCQGVFSQDFQNVIVTCGPPDFILTAVDPATGAKAPVQALLSESLTGIRVNE